MFYIPQISQNGCGYACVNMMLANLRKDKNFLYVPYPEKENNSSFEELITYARNMGLYLRAFKADEKETFANVSELPLIASISPFDGLNHAVVVYKVSKGKVYYLDPDNNGECKMKIDAFIKIWTGYGLLIEKDDSNPCQSKPLSPIPKANLVLTFLVQMFAGLLAVCSILFLDEKFPSYLSISLIGGSLVFEIILRLLSFKTLNNVDENVYKEISNKKNDYQKVFERLEDYKKNVMVNPLRFISFSIILLFIMIIVIFNDIRNAPIIVLPIALAIIDSVLFTPDIKSKAYQLGLKEKEIKNALNIDDFKEKSRLIHKEAYCISKYISFKNIFIYFAIIVVSVACCFTLKQVKLPYALFYIMIGISTFTNCKYLISYTEKKKEADFKRAKLNNIIYLNNDINE